MSGKAFPHAKKTSGAEGRKNRLTSPPGTPAKSTSIASLETDRETYLSVSSTAGRIILCSPRRSKTLQLAAVPKSIDLRKLCAPIRAQGKKKKACSGFATAAFRENQLRSKRPASCCRTIYRRPIFTDGPGSMMALFPNDSGAKLGRVNLAFYSSAEYVPKATFPTTPTPAEGPNPVADTAAQPLRIVQPVQVNWKVPAIVKSTLASQQNYRHRFFRFINLLRTRNQRGSGFRCQTRPKRNSWGGHGVLGVRL